MDMTKKKSETFLYDMLIEFEYGEETEENNNEQ